MQSLLANFFYQLCVVKFSKDFVPSFIYKFNSTLLGFAGDAHFDDDEWFTLGSKHGTNFYWVALHEFGHSIGMEHSDKLGAIMYPWYQGYKGDDVDLTDDDIQGIQALYGK